MRTPEELELYRRFYKVLDETAELFELLITFENKKLDAIAVNDVELLEQHMHEEQAFLLKLRGLDQRREKLQKDMGFEGRSFAHMIQEGPEEERENMEKRKTLLNAKSEELKAAVDCTKKYIELHLHSLDNLLAQMTAENKTYDKSGAKVPGDPPVRFKPTKV